VNPQVSVIVPCYNEAATIGLLLESLARQDCGRPRLEVLLSDGMSQDATRQVAAQVAARYEDLTLRIIDNPDRSIPAALNRAIAAARGEILIRLDAHSIPAEDYIRRCLEALQATGAANVGGQWEIRPSASGAVATSIVEAGSHPLGAGDARYRTGGKAGPVETVPFGAFPRGWLEKVGGYDESLLANEDYELNLRLRRAGGVVWFDPAIRSVYFARPTLRAVGSQYFRYGFWKGRMLLRYPESLRWRQAAAPALVFLSAALAGLSLWLPAARLLLALEWVGYALVLLICGVERAFRRRNLDLAWGLPAALATIHWIWGVGFWWGILTGWGRSLGDRQSSSS
jgi:cellulose synthase/poly-beta-1,6-N-acetylglucosamine synthase-like glycosyltransferase